MPTPKKLGIIAGGGNLPAQLADFCKNQNQDFCIAGIKNQTNEVKADRYFRIGQASQLIDFFKSEKVSDIVFIGSVTKPSFWTLWPDWPTFKFFLSAWLKSLGDDGLLKAARQELEKRGFRIRGIHEFLPDLLMPEGSLGQAEVSETQSKDIKLGLKESQTLGKQDIGQAVIIKGGEVIAREDEKGTNAMIRRYGTEGAILVKTCKPQQDRDLDLPTLGLKTVEACAIKKMSGIVGQAHNTLLVDREEAISAANDHGMFLIGIKLDE